MNMTVLRATIDPNGAFKDFHPEQIIDACGLLPEFAAQALVNPDFNHSFKEALIGCYQFYSGPMTGGKINEDGQYSYPGDPILSPLAKIESEEIDEVCYIYQYAIVGTVASDGTQWIARMD